MDQIQPSSKGSALLIIDYFEPCLRQDVNTYACYLRRLDFVYYPAPAKGYKARLTVLLVAFSLILLITIAQLVLIEMERRRNRRPYWIFRFTQVGSHHFLVSNQSLIAAYAVLVGVTVNINFVAGEWKQNVNHGDQWWRAARRTSVCFPPMMGGLLASFSLLQAFIVILGRKGRKWSKHTLRFTVAAFFICVILYCAAFITLTVLAATTFHRQWSLYLGLRQSLMSDIPNWTSALNPVLSDEQLAQLISLRASTRPLWILQTASKSVYTTVATLNLGLACLCVAIWVMIRQQLERHASSITALHARETMSSTYHTIDYAETLPADSAQTITTRPAPVGKPSWPSSTMSTEFGGAGLQLDDDTDDARYIESAKRVRELKRAGAWVLLLGGAVVISSALMAGTIGWTVTLVTIPFSSPNPQKGQTVKSELGIFLFLWVWTAIVFPFSIISLIEAIKHLPSKNSVAPSNGSSWDSRDLESSTVMDPSRRDSDQSGTHHQEDSLEAFLRSLEPIPEVAVPGSRSESVQMIQSRNATPVIAASITEEPKAS